MQQRLDSPDQKPSHQTTPNVSAHRVTPAKLADQCRQYDPRPKRKHNEMLVLKPHNRIRLEVISLNVPHSSVPWTTKDPTAVSKPEALGGRVRVVFERVGESEKDIKHKS